MAYKVLLTPAAEEDFQHIVAWPDKHFGPPMKKGHYTLHVVRAALDRGHGC